MNPRTHASNAASTPSTLPRVLLVEDDATSQAYLATVLRGIPLVIDCAGSIAEALRLARQHAYDLWLFDAQLPDGSGSELLSMLKTDHPRVPAIAHTASTEPTLWAALVAAGFARVLVKPMAAQALRSAVQHALGLPPESELAVPEPIAADTAGVTLWDDEAAARALNFNTVHVEALRKLFLAELPPAREAIMAAAREGDEAGMRAGLHKLRASCGFVGAAGLAAAIDALHRHPHDSPLVAHFDRVAADTAATPLPVQSAG